MAERDNFKVHKGTTFNNKIYHLDNYSLNDKEIKKIQDDGLLSKKFHDLKNLNFLTLSKDSDFYNNPELHFKTCGYKEEEILSFGVKAYFYFYDYSEYDRKKRKEHIALYVTDFYLIIYDGLKDDFKIVPLNKIKKIEIISNDLITWNEKAETREVKKNPTVGALVGGAIAGTPGAIIGASVHSGTETKVVKPGGIAAIQYYKIVCLMEDDCQYVIPYYSVHINHNFKEIEKMFKEKNELVATIIKRSKEKLSKEEKKQIV